MSSIANGRPLGIWEFLVVPNDHGKGWTDMGRTLMSYPAMLHPVPVYHGNRWTDTGRTLMSYPAMLHPTVHPVPVYNGNAGHQCSTCVLATCIYYYAWFTE